MARDRYRGYGRTLNAWIAFVTTLSLVPNFGIPVSTASSIPHTMPRAPIAGGNQLRVLAIGDSITYGAPGPIYNGYRKELTQLLTGRGNVVDNVGAIKAGDFANNANEGHRGMLIDEISDMSSVGIWAGPNIVLLHAGTNDMNRNEDPQNAPARLSSLIDYIYQNSRDAAVFVAQIIPSKNSATEARIKAFNAAIPGLVQSWVNRGKNVTLVDMHTGFSAASDLYDELHPNDQGYSKMASRWYDAINAADQRRFIQEPPKKRTPPANAAQHCPGTPSWQSKGEIAAGARVAHDDSLFEQSWDKIGTFSKHECDPSRLFFPDLDGDGYGDWACVQENDGAVLAFLQVPVNGKPANNWQKLGTVATGEPGRKSGGVFFADVDGDGRDDYVYIDNGNVNVWINGGSSAGGGWIWNNIGVVNGNDVGATRQNLQMADIDGDGRADFLLVDNATGEVTAWLNGGTGDKPDYYKIGLIATGRSHTANDIVIMGDFTGNGKADYMLVGQSGKVTGFANFVQERGFIPAWQTKVTVAAGPAGAEQKYVRLVDVNGDGKVDYLLLDKNGGSQLWLNTGRSGKWQVGDGLFLADLDGDGANDYIWLDGSANTYGYLNSVPGTNSWNNLGLVRSSSGPVDLRHVRWAPLTNSKRADFILIDDVQGACLWSQNLGSQGDGQPYKWADFGVAATGPRHTVVAAPYNWKWDSKRVRFADMNGDGLADYLYVNTNGAVLMWKNLGTNPPSWGPAQLIAAGSSKGAWWTEIQFADTDGAGVADYLQVDRITGRTWVWRNNGFQADGSIAWSPYTEFAAGPGPAGLNIRIVDMTAEGRADYVSVDPRTGGLTLWKNNCPAGTSTGSNPSEGDNGTSPPSQPVPQLLKDNPDLFYWPAYNDTDGNDGAFFVRNTAVNGEVGAFDGNWFGTGLFGYDECSKRGLDKRKIDDAYYDMWYLTNTDGVGKDIDWNSAAALEFLGPPANNKDYQAHIQNMLFNAAETSQSRFKNVHYIHVRCDDWAHKCTVPCNPDGSPASDGEIYAYTAQSDTNGYTTINFCPPFFDLRRLRNAALDYGKSLSPPTRYWVQKYENTALVFLHELLHADYFMSNSPAEHVQDLEIRAKVRGQERDVIAYGATLTKILARWNPFQTPTQFPAGYYVARNADNMAWFALAKYVQDKLGIYPHLPVVSQEPKTPPVSGSPFLTTFSGITDPNFVIPPEELSTQASPNTCSGQVTNDGGPQIPPLPITALAGDDAYPADYLAQRGAWIAELGGDSSPTTTTTASPSKPTCQGSQVQGDCVTNFIPPSPPFSGTKGPSCAKADGSPGSAARLNADAVARGASGYCDSLKQAKVLLSKDDTTVRPAIFAGQAENGKDMTMTVLFFDQACPTDKQTTTLDFATYDRQKCIDSFYAVLAQVCSQDSSWPTYNKDFTLMGGVWGNDCAMWSLQSQ